MKSIGHIAVALCLLLYGGGITPVAGQQAYRSALLKTIAHQIEIPMPTEDGVHYKVLDYDGFPVTVVVGDGEVKHIGLSLFTPSQRMWMDEMQCNFLERLALSARMSNVYGTSIRQYLKDEKVEFSHGDINTMARIANDTSFVFKSALADGKTYVVCWYSAADNQPYCALTYPADFHLISGMTMVEAENRLCDDIRRCHLKEGMDKSVAVNVSMLQRMGKSKIYLHKGNAYFIPELNADRYYVEDTDGTFSLLNDKAFPLETFSNYVTGTEVENDLIIDVKLVKYGYHVDEFTVPLRNWIGFCIQSGCTPYFGVISQENNKIVGELIMHNESLGYNHVMKLVLDPSVLAKDKGVVYARLNSYVPMSNVKSLFDEN